MSQTKKFHIVDVRDVNNTRYTYNEETAKNVCEILNEEYRKESPFDLVFKNKVFFFFVY